MKKINKYLAVALASLSVASCADLDTQYYGSYVTDDQKNSAQEASPEVADVATINSYFTMFNRYMSVYSYHCDFGFPAILLGLESQGTDLIGGDTGYNWFLNWEGYYSCTASGMPTNMAWYTLYNQLYAANNIISTYKGSTDEGDEFLLAQGYAGRAFDYWVLAQLYAFNYVGHESDLCVPIVTDENTDDIIANGVGLSTVQEVYDLIDSDINKAVALLESSSVAPASVMDSKPKRLISLATAYGLRARIELTKHEYAKAAADAQLAIDNFSGKPYTMSEVSVPTFTSLEDESWMWGIAISENDNVVTSGIVNWPSMVCSFAYGYVTVGAWRWCNKDLYSNIPKSDVRKDWFLNTKLESSHLTSEQTAYLQQYSSIEAYTNVKFNSYQGVLNQSTNASDYPLMRIEEMYYILAEGQAMSGNVTGALTTLNDFVSYYRDPSYKCEITDPESLQEEIWMQRRIEFWGEGLSWFDIMRLNKGVDRIGGGFPSGLGYSLSAGDSRFIYCIPSSEISSNKKLDASVVNEGRGGSVPGAAE
jgi:hypothetical protein